MAREERENKDLRADMDRKVIQRPAKHPDDQTRKPAACQSLAFEESGPARARRARAWPATADL